jgi:hypothetical protein
MPAFRLETFLQAQGEGLDILCFPAISWPFDAPVGFQFDFSW